MGANMGDFLELFRIPCFALVAACASGEILLVGEIERFFGENSISKPEHAAFAVAITVGSVERSSGLASLNGLGNEYLDFEGSLLIKDLTRQSLMRNLTRAKAGRHPTL